MLIRIEHLRQHLAVLESEVTDSLNRETQRLSDSLVEYETTTAPSLGQIEKFLNDFGKARKLDDVNLQRLNRFKLNLHKINRTINEKVNALNFEVQIDMPSASDIVGRMSSITCKSKNINLSKVKSKNLITSVNSRPIYPNDVMLVDERSVLLVDKRSKAIVKLDLNGNFESTCSLANTMRSPECLCYDHVGCFYYVSDSDSNLIYKFDQNFKNIQKIGSKANLRSPKGKLF